MFESVLPYNDEVSFHDQAAVLRVTLDNMDQGLIMTDPVGRVVVCNKRAIQLLNLPLALMASQPRLEEVIAYQLRHGELEGFPTELTVQSIQECVRPNGMVLEIRCVPLPEGGVVCTYTDVTERRESAEQLRAARDAAEMAREQAEAASRAKTDFLATMSHEIRTPLNAVIGFADLIADSGRLEPDLQRHADIIRSSGHALLTVVNDILDFSKVEAGKILLTQTCFSPSAMAESCIAIVRGGAINKSLSIDLQLDAALPAALIGDESRLRQVLLNLLNNAVKFTRRGSVTLAIRHEGRDAAGDVCRFSIRDTGIGIAKDKQDRLFQTFSQVDTSIGRDFGGTGLGLAICRRLVELMGGTIGVESELGAGAEFWFRVSLPIGNIAALKPEDASRVSSSRRARLLLVEDVEVNQELARLVLESVGHSVDVAADGEAAIAAVRNQPYDLVLMDVQMLGMDGLTATQLIRALPAPAGVVPIIAMTANVLPEQIRQFRDAGMTDWVGKPFKRAELYAVIDRALGDGRDDVRASPQDDPIGRAGEEWDAAIFDQLVDLLGTRVVGGLLVKFASDLEACFALMRSHPQARIEVRRHVHDLVSAMGMMGLARLAQSFSAILAFDEERVRIEGEQTFIQLLESTLRIGADTVALIHAMATDLDRRDEQPGIRSRNRPAVSDRERVALAGA